MPVTAQQLKDRVEARVEDTIPDSIFLDYLNEGLQDLTEVLRLETKAEGIVTVAAPKMPLPADVKEILLVSLVNTGEVNEIAINDKYSFGYTKFNNELDFTNCIHNNDTAVVYYYRHPVKALALTDNLDIPDQFDNALLYYVATCSKRDQEESELEVAYGNKYEVRKAEIDEETRKKVGIHKRYRVRVHYPAFY